MPPRAASSGDTFYVQIMFYKSRVTLAVNGSTTLETLKSQFLSSLPTLDPFPPFSTSTSSPTPTSTKDFLLFRYRKDSEDDSIIGYHCLEGDVEEINSGEKGWEEEMRKRGKGSLRSLVEAAGGNGGKWVELFLCFKNKKGKFPTEPIVTLPTIDDEEPEGGLPGGEEGEGDGEVMEID